MSGSALAKNMTLAELDNGYWYATELKAFAKTLGIPNGRKDQLERAIRAVLSGKPVRAHAKQRTTGPRDVDQGLRPSLRVVRYTNDPETKDFLEREARKLDPGFKRRSGLRYRFNRWRDAQLEKGVALTYRDLVAEYVRLNAPEVKYQRIPHGRYINFIADFLKHEKHATREAAVKAWHQLKKLDVPKDYRSWLKSS
jgi:hypothetical protein